MRILVADDDKRVAHIIGKAFASKEWEIVPAFDSVQAIQIATHQGPDVIVLDLRMPGGSGVGVLSRLKRLPATMGIPVIVLSGMTDAEDAAIRAGAEKFLPKPVDLGVLEQEILRVTGAGEEADT